MADSVIPDSADVTVNYNGSTVDMGGSSYVNQGDVSGIVNQAVNATLGKLRGSSRARLCWRLMETAIAVRLKFYKDGVTYGQWQNFWVDQTIDGYAFVNFNCWRYFDESYC